MRCMPFSSISFPPCMSIPPLTSNNPTECHPTLPNLLRPPWGYRTYVHPPPLHHWFLRYIHMVGHMGGEGRTYWEEQTYGRMNKSGGGGETYVGWTDGGRAHHFPSPRPSSPSLFPFSPLLLPSSSWLLPSLISLPHHPHFFIDLHLIFHQRVGWRGGIYSLYIFCL